MSVDEHARHELYTKAIELFGEKDATTLMAHLPPGGWPNLATKQDILLLRQDFEQLKLDVEGDLRELERRLKAEIIGELKSYTLKTVLVANFGLAATFATIAFTAAGLS